jgi:hypothetical protein
MKTFVQEPGRTADPSAVGERSNAPSICSSSGLIFCHSTVVLPSSCNSEISFSIWGAVAETSRNFLGLFELIAG